MFRSELITALFAGVLALATLGEVQAQASREPRAYSPSFGDLMTVVIQPRHLKLGLAGQEKNWVYADYELRELQGAFRRVASAVPVYRSTDMTSLIDATMVTPMGDVATAIKTGNSDKFVEAFARLTATCNACHESTDHAQIVIQVPKASAFPNQDFRSRQP
jgi:hypothetical protein